tara:strand:+ start:1505 stop:1846 length:342 start_codon:yes stop_codon:yes gene_type:complete
MEKHYQVICQECNGQRKVKIADTTIGKRIDWLEEKQTEPFTIISGRERLDRYLGWQCLCGNNSLMTKQEQDTIADKSNPQPQEINQITQNLQNIDIVITGKDIILDKFILREV